MEVDSYSNTEEELEEAVNDLKNNSLDSYFNIPVSDLCEWNFLSTQSHIVHLTTDHHPFFSLYTSNTTAFNYYNVVVTSEGDGSIGLGIKFVPAMC